MRLGIDMGLGQEAAGFIDFLGRESSSACHEPMPAPRSTIAGSFKPLPVLYSYSKVRLPIDRSLSFELIACCYGEEERVH
jgi:hypothetical protein